MEQDSLVIPHESYPNEYCPLRNSSIVPNRDHSSEHRTFFNPAKVEQWVANSTSGSDAFLHSTPPDQSGVSNGFDPSLPCVEPEISGSFSLSRSAVSHLSLQHSTQISGAHGSMMTYDDTCTANAAARLDSSLDFSQGLDFDGNMSFLREQYSHDLWPYQVPLNDDSLFSSSATVHAACVADESGLCSTWSAAPFQAGDEILSAAIPCGSQPAAWSPLLAVDPSVSSSLSQSSTLVALPNAPMSPALQEDTWHATQRGTYEEEGGVYQHFSIGDAMEFPPTVYTEGSTDIRFVQQ